MKTNIITILIFVAMFLATLINTGNLFLGFVIGGGAAGGTALIYLQNKLNRGIADFINTIVDEENARNEK